MTEVVLAPHELLNQSMKAPSVDPEGEKKLKVATDIFVAALKSRLDSPETISQQSINIAATIAVDAAEILLSKLAGKR